MLEANATLNEILLRTESKESSKLLTSSSKDVQEVEHESPNAEDVVRPREREVDTAIKHKRNRGKAVSTTATAAVVTKRTNQKVVDRRRRRGQRLSSESSDSEGEEEERGVGDSSSESSLSMPSDGESGEDIQVLESLSDSSASEDERPPQQRNSNQISSQPLTNQAGRKETTSETTSSNPATDSGKPRTSGRRQIVLAASFNLAPSSSTVADPSPPASDDTNAATSASNDASLAQAKTTDDSHDAGDTDDAGDRLLKEVYCDTVECSCVHTACSILAEDSYLTPIKVFTDWLHTYSIVLAATSKQVSMHDTMCMSPGSIPNFSMLHTERHGEPG